MKLHSLHLIKPWALVTQKKEVIRNSSVLPQHNTATCDGFQKDHFECAVWLYLKLGVMWYI